MNEPSHRVHRTAPGAVIPDALPADGLLTALPGEPVIDVRRPRGWSIAAWLLIAAVAGLVIVRTAMHKRSGGGAAAESIVTIQMQGRYLVGAAGLGLPGADRKALYAQARDNFNQGSYSQRLRFVVLAGELAGPDEALKALKGLEADRASSNIGAGEDAVKAAIKLQRLYEGYRQEPAKPALTAEDQLWLRSRLGWFGELALAPDDGDSSARSRALAPARRTLVVYLTAFGLALGGFVAGGFLLLVLALLACLGRLRGGLDCGSGWGGIYAETFALYMALFVGLSYLARFVAVPARLHMAAGAVIAFASLLALLWPRLRGLSWRQIRIDLGLHFDGQPFVQLLFGPLCYLCAVPLLLGGMLITLMLMFGQRYLGLGDPFRPGAGPSHPIMAEALGSDPWVWLQVFLVACIAAPIVEEIMFRGVLYRHLREASWRWGRFLSIAFSALASSFVFAAIHPQGWLGIPVLLALAFAFALAREWRRSLVPAVIAHGINNAVGMLLLLLAAT
jgi:membrane protease YdiL (CAAX protease family)